MHLRPIKIDESINIDFLARQTPGFSGADIANVCNEAALIAARKKKNSCSEGLHERGGSHRGRIGKEEQDYHARREKIDRHTRGRTYHVELVLGACQPAGEGDHCAARKSTGAAWYLPEERQITTKDQMLDEMCALLGGRAAEDLFIGQISSGAMNDLERVTKQAYAMVTYMGMSDKLPNLSYYDTSGQEYTFSKPYSDETARLIDTEVKG